MIEMVDRVARAMREACPFELRDQTAHAMARAAIEEMREPTKAMVLAGIHHDNMGDMEGRWNAMIDEALKP